MIKTLVVCLVLLVVPVGATEWERIEKLPDAVANSEVVLQYTDGSLAFLRKSKGTLTVETFVDFLARWELDNGQLPSFLFWAKKDNEYVAVWKLPPGEEELIIYFTHLLSKRQGGGSLSRFAGIDGGDRVFGSNDMGTAVGSMFIRALQSDIDTKYREAVEFPRRVGKLLGSCKRSSDAKLKWLSDGKRLFHDINLSYGCARELPKCEQDQSVQCVDWRAGCDQQDPLCFSRPDRACDACQELATCLRGMVTILVDIPLYGVFGCMKDIHRTCSDFPDKCDKVVREACKKYPDVCGGDG